MTNVEALKALYHALGGDLDDVADVSTIVGVLNAIAAKYEGNDDATLNADAIENIAEIAGSLTPTPTLITKNITENGTYTASTEDADGYSEVTVDVAGGETFEVEITAHGEPGSYTFSANKTYSETMAAIQNGDAVSFKYIMGAETIDCLCYFLMVDGDTDEYVIAVILQAEYTSAKFIITCQWDINDNFQGVMWQPAQT